MLIIHSITGASSHGSVIYLFSFAWEERQSLIVFLLIWSENTWDKNGRYVDLEETEASEKRRRIIRKNDNVDYRAILQQPSMLKGERVIPTSTLR